MADDAFTRVAVTDWDRLCRELAAFDATLDRTDDEVTLTSGNATFRIDRDGSVAGGMPLHDYDDDVTALRLDPADDRVRVERDGTVTYEFRFP